MTTRRESDTLLGHVLILTVHCTQTREVSVLVWVDKMSVDQEVETLPANAEVLLTFDGRVETPPMGYQPVTNK